MSWNKIRAQILKYYVRSQGERGLLYSKCGMALTIEKSFIFMNHCSLCHNRHLSRCNIEIADSGDDLQA